MQWKNDEWLVVSYGFPGSCSPLSGWPFSVRHPLDKWKLLMKSVMIA